MPKNRTSACGRMLEHVLPPNVPADTMQGIIVGSLAIGALTAAIDFTVHYAATYRGMFYWDGRLMDTALMGPFSAYVEPVVIVFGVVVLLALLSSVMLYSSYYLGGRSIYLMRRLPDGRQTLRRQVWTAPLVWAVCAVAVHHAGAVHSHGGEYPAGHERHCRVALCALLRLRRDHICLRSAISARNTVPRRRCTMCP